MPVQELISCQLNLSTSDEIFLSWNALCSSPSIRQDSALQAVASRKVHEVTAVLGSPAHGMFALQPCAAGTLHRPCWPPWPGVWPPLTHPYFHRFRSIIEWLEFIKSSLACWEHQLFMSMISPWQREVLGLLLAGCGMEVKMSLNDLNLQG